MFDALRERLAYQAALKAAQRRTVAHESRPHTPRILVVLPHEEDALRAVWDFVKSIEGPKANILPVSLGDRIPYTPDAFVGAVYTVGAKDRDWRGLPKAAVAKNLWTQRPDLAFDFSRPFDLAAAYLVGASPARFRVGLHSDEAEPFFDFMLAPTGGFAQALDALRGYLPAVSPTLIVFD